MTAPRRYGTARVVFSILELVGWLSVVFGLGLALIGVATGGLLSALFQETNAGLRILSAVPGLVTAILGLMSVAQVQNARATVDNAEMTGEMLRISRRQELTTFGNNEVGASDSTLGGDWSAPGATNAQRELSGVTKPSLSSVGTSPDFKMAEEVFEYRGRKVYRVGLDFFVDGDPERQAYASLPIAKYIIDKSASSA